MLLQLRAITLRSSSPFILAAAAVVVVAAAAAALAAAAAAAQLCSSSATLCSLVGSMLLSGISCIDLSSAFSIFFSGRFLHSIRGSSKSNSYPFFSRIRELGLLPSSAVCL
jgi:hypothetical protein